MEEAPYFDDIAHGPDGGQAFWTTASDGVRLRIGYWPGGNRGTVLLFPGRTEYIEKYGPAAADLQARGYSTLTIDWRGQGLSDRFTENRLIGHVENYSDYQLDVASMVDAAAALDCPGPFYLVAHSMGGSIGLRALHNGLDVRAVSFTGPMWGIAMSPFLRAISAPVAMLLKAFGQGKNFAPTTRRDSYVLGEPFQNNELTTDPDMYAFLQNQVTEYPDLTLAGPSVNWLDEALRECAALTDLGAADIPTLVYMGALERIVDPDPVRQIMGNWPNGDLHMVPNAEHEIIMETPAIRRNYFDEMDQLFTSNSN